MVKLVYCPGTLIVPLSLALLEVVTRNSLVSGGWELARNSIPTFIPGDSKKLIKENRKVYLENNQRLLSEVWE